ncbi:uncharacterized protein HD556DRAFT_1440382 [Suillus plorans]|uniref:Uncharacterized protein n=1 Tax=Suillus plorans TaxID=116603 RepID=A0A9P7DLV0_9AGAM|nr:uncharacterized protein HD556DRAFT_1440382 [Suillus plorans]KAG1798049.1 hypothetical protein HD556DRAFT_1440382 [Suillus plorans]
MSSHSLANRLSTGFKYRGSNGGTMKIEFIRIQVIGCVVANSYNMFNIQQNEDWDIYGKSIRMLHRLALTIVSRAFRIDYIDHTEKVRSSACFLKVFLSTCTGRASLYVRTNFDYIRPYLRLPNDYDKAIDLYSTAIDLNSTFDTLANRSKAKLGEMLWEDALLDMQKVTGLNPSSHIGYQLTHTVLRGAQRYDEAIEAFTIMLSKLDDAPKA